MYYNNIYVYIGYYYCSNCSFLSLPSSFFSFFGSSPCIQKPNKKCVHDPPLFSPRIICLLSLVRSWLFLMSCPQYVSKGIFQTMAAFSLRGIKMSNVRIVFFQLVIFIYTHQGFHILKINIKNTDEVFRLSSTSKILIILEKESFLAV